MKVGDYVRSDKGISKIILIEPKENNLIKYKVDNYDINCYVNEDFPIKSSPNIIDLIEEGDYVNGEPVMNIHEKNEKYAINYIFDEKTLELKNDNYETVPHDALITNNNIETVITKEQFKEMEYKCE